MGLSPQILADNLVWLSGSQRNMLLTRGTPGTLRFAAFSAHDDKHLKNIKAHLIAQKLHLKKLSSPLFKNSCFAFVDPDGNNILLGLPKSLRGKPEILPGRLQHVVFATNQLKRNVAFYTDTLGFKVSDIVREDTTGEDTACFLRSDKMHHSIAFFRAPKAKLDHFANEADCWNDIRDWGDHFAANKVEIVWGRDDTVPGIIFLYLLRIPMEIAWKSLPSWKCSHTINNHGFGHTDPAPLISGAKRGCEASGLC